MRRLKQIALVLLLLMLSGIVLLFTIGMAIVWDGRFELTVQLQTNSKRTIRVVCFPIRQLNEANAAAARLQQVSNLKSASEDEYRVVIVDPYAGESITVYVPVGGKESVMGFDLERYQFEWLVLVAEQEDGTRISLVVEIPDCRKSKTITVKFPP